MKTNVGKTDRLVRIILALLISTLYFANVITEMLGVVLMFIAAILLITAIVGFCGLYQIFGINTCPRKEKP